MHSFDRDAEQTSEVDSIIMFKVGGLQCISLRNFPKPEGDTEAEPGFKPSWTHRPPC